MSAAAESILSFDEEGAPTTRCRILSVAERFFREIGYRKTTVADIARALAMSPANVYRFFDSKRAINEAVFARFGREIEAMLAGLAQAEGLSASERLTRMILALHRDCRERCEAFPRIHEMIEAAMTESWSACRTHVDTLVDAFERVIADGIAAGEFATADARLAASCVHTAVVRYSHPVLVSVARCETAAPPLDAMIVFLLRGLRGPAAAR